MAEKQPLEPGYYYDPDGNLVFDKQREIDELKRRQEEELRKKAESRKGMLSKMTGGLFQKRNKALEEAAQ